MKSEWFEKIMLVYKSLKAGGMIVGCAVILAVMAFSGCGESGGEAPPPIIIFDEDDFLAEIREAKDIFDLAAIQDDYRNANDRSDRVDQTMKERWGEFLESVEPIGAISDEAELIVFKYEKNQGGRYRLNFLFKVNHPFARDYLIGVQGYVDESDTSHLSPTANKKYGFEHWGFTPIPSTSQWKHGEYQIITSEVVAEPIPYKLLVNLYIPKEGTHGSMLDLGWVADSGMDEEELLREINSVEGILELDELSRLYSFSRVKLPGVDEAFDNKWKQLLADSGPPRPFCDEVNLLDFKYSKIGDNKYRLSYLFDVKKEIPEECSKYFIYVHGHVDDNHVDMLSEAANKKYKFENWGFAPSPAISDWKIGDKILVTRDITAQPIPYKIQTGFYKPGGGGPGIGCDLGWQASVGDGND